MFDNILVDNETKIKINDNHDYNRECGESTENIHS